MGSGGGYGNFFRTYKGGSFSQRGFNTKLNTPVISDPLNKHIENLFSDRIKKIHVSDYEQYHLDDVKNKISAALSKDMTVSGINVIGSTAKNTQIKNGNGNDIDIMVELDREEYNSWMDTPNGSSNCLIKIKRALQKNFNDPDIQIRIDRNVVTVDFGYIKADVIPAFSDNENGYLIPDTVDKPHWVKTNPKIMARVFNNLDKRNHNQLSKLTMLVKDWNKRNGNILKSFHIESMTYDYFANNKPKDGDNSLKTNTREFFERMPYYLRRGVKEPVYNEDVAAYLNSDKKREVVKKIQKCNELLRKGERAARKGNETETSENYSKFLGGE
jgi:predicted nucleotidyltransferase